MGLKFTDILFTILILVKSEGGTGDLCMFQISSTPIHFVQYIYLFKSHISGHLFSSLSNKMLKTYSMSSNSFNTLEHDPLLRLLDVAEAKSKILRVTEEVIYRDPNILKNKKNQHKDGETNTGPNAPVVTKYIVDGVKYNGAKNALYTLLDKCEVVQSDKHDKLFDLYGDTIMMIPYWNVLTKSCSSKETSLQHGARVDSQLREWCELIASNLSSRSPDESLLQYPSTKRYMETAGAYLTPDYDSCALNTSEYIWEFANILPLEAQFPIFSPKMGLATEVDIIGTSRSDMGRNIVVMELKSSAKMTMENYVGNGKKNFTDKGKKNLPLAGKLLQGLPDCSLTRDLLQLLLSISMITTEYEVDRQYIKGYLIKACSNGIVSIEMTDALWNKVGLLRTIMQNYEELKKPYRKEAKKQKVMDKFAAIKKENFQKNLKVPAHTKSDSISSTEKNGKGKRKREDT